MTTLKAWIQSILVWIFVVVTLIAIYPLSVALWIFTVPFDKRRAVFRWFTNLWGSMYTWLAPFWKVIIEQREFYDKKKVYVIISNHQSLLDILVISRLFMHFKWVSKNENFKVPIMGWVMSMNKDIRLKRGRQSSIRDMMKEGVKMLNRGSSLMIFPEGTRSETTQMRNFKEGAFRLAKEADVPILPVIIDGTGDALPKKGFIIRGKHMLKVRLMEEIPVETVREKSATALKETSQHLISEALHGLRNQTA